MRKTKDIKRKRKEAGLAYRRGQRKEAYEMWASAKKELDDLRGRNKPAPAPEGGAE
ncbi:MAG TPA: hypothetical protein P5081_12130 [Phycisphaerae bacterium]|nr:hypothetical protein [Phycisphaerae bacterium]HRW53624.1 hypothetical protein [Phycisphaerae bacterium]